MWKHGVSVFGQARVSARGGEGVPSPSHDNGLASWRVPEHKSSDLICRASLKAGTEQVEAFADTTGSVWYVQSLHYPVSVLYLYPTTG